MKKALGTILALIFAFGSAPTAQADRVIVYPSQNPSSVETNQQARFERLAYGTWMRDALGASNSAAGVYNNLTVSPNGGMYVAVQPSTSNTLGSLYQVSVSDSADVPYGSYTPQLSSDATQIVVQGLLAGTSGSIGPLSAPSSGLSQYYLIEAQVQTNDTTPEALTFVSNTGQTSTQTVNTARQDQIVFQAKVGTASSSPTPPTVDSGWIAIAQILIPGASTSITSGMITMEPAFAGFVANGSNVTISGLSISSLSDGCVQSLSHVISTYACTSGLGSVVGDYPIVASTASGVATASCPTCVTSVSATGNIASTGGTMPSLSLSNSPTFSGSETFTGSYPQIILPQYGGLTTVAGADAFTFGNVGYPTYLDLNNASSNVSSFGSSGNSTAGVSCNLFGMALLGGSTYFCFDQSGDLGATSYYAQAGTTAYATLGVNPAAASSPNTYAGIWYDTTNSILRLDALSGGVSYRDIVLGGLSSAEKVGIGTLAPSYELDVTGNVGSTSSLTTGDATAHSCTAGDICASRGTSSGALELGGSSAFGIFDYGASNSGAFTLNHTLYLPGVNDSTLTASALAVTDSSKNLASGIVGDGLLLSSGTLSVNNCASSICTVKLAIGLGYQTGAMSTSTDFPDQPIVGYSGAYITGLRASCKSADNGTTQIELVLNGGYVGGAFTLSTSRVSSLTYGSPIAIAAGDDIYINLITAGTATGCGFIAEGYQQVQ